MSHPNTGHTFTLPEALSRAHAHWTAGQASQAEQLCQRVLAAVPGQPDALHLLGLMAHAHGKLDLAIIHLQAACNTRQAPAAYWANLTEMCRQKGMLAQAEAAGRQAVARDATLVAGWNNLGIALQEAGKFAESRDCLERVVELQPASPEACNNLANTYRRLGHFDLAETWYRRALTLNPHYAQAHSNLAFLLSTQGRSDEAAAEARLAIDLDPRLIDAYLNLAEIEMSRHRGDASLRALDMLQAFAPRHHAGLIARAKALRQLERLDAALRCAREAVALAPQSADAHHTLAVVLQSFGLTDAALDAYEQAVALPGTVHEDALLGRAALLLEAGRKDEALAGFDAALAAFPDSVRVLASRADTRTFTRHDPDIATLEAFVGEGDARSLSDRISARFALGKAYIDIGDGPRAFAHLDEGNRLKRAAFAYDGAATSAWMARIAQTFTAQRYADFAGSGAVSELPVFVLGMPRSGTTLIEQILASHPQVTGAGELSALRLCLEAAGSYPSSIAAMTRDDLARIGADYLARVTPLAEGRARLVDKMPANFLYAGLIPLILSGARIVHARRNPVDTCLSCYIKLFGGEQRFAFNQTELGEFYRHYDTLMAHLRTVLPPERFIEVDYEAVVDDVEREARRLIDFVGLPWDEACLAFHRTRRVVRTASVNQVRQPIYTTSKGRWRRYAPHLKPLLAALGIEQPASDETGPSSAS
jgi:tetratricopeptide (TPR) repeat protein